MGAALVRVVLPMLGPAWTVQAVLVSGAMWSAAFAMYFLTHAAVLTRPRVDAPAARVPGIAIRERS